MPNLAGPLDKLDTITKQGNPIGADYWGDPEDRPACQCWCGCMRWPGRNCRRECEECHRLVGRGCCWDGDAHGTCHMCSWWNYGGRRQTGAPPSLRGDRGRRRRPGQRERRANAVAPTSKVVAQNGRKRPLDGCHTQDIWTAVITRHESHILEGRSAAPPTECLDTNPREEVKKPEDRRSSGFRICQNCGCYEPFAGMTDLCCRTTHGQDCDFGDE